MKESLFFIRIRLDLFFFKWWFFNWVFESMIWIYGGKWRKFVKKGNKEKYMSIIFFYYFINNINIIWYCFG